MARVSGSGKNLKKYKVVFTTQVIGMDALNRLNKRIEGMITRFENLGKAIEDARGRMEAFNKAAGGVANDLERAANAVSLLARKQRGILPDFTKKLRESKQLAKAEAEAAEGGRAPGRARGRPPKEKSGFFFQQTQNMKTAAQEMMFVVRAARAAAVAYGAILATLPARAFSEKALEQSRRADFVGLSKQQFQAFDAISKQFGAGEGDLMDLLGTLSDRSLDVVKGTGYLEDFKLLGLAAKDLAGPDGHLKNTADLLYTFSDAVAKIENPAERVGAVMRVLGDDVGRKMGPMVMYGADRLREMAAEMEQAGVIFDDTSESLGVRFALALRKTTLLLKAQYDFLGLSLISAFDGLIARFNKISLSNAPWLRARLRELSQTWETLSYRIANNVEALDDWLKKGGLEGGIYEAIERLTQALGGLLVALGILNAGPILMFTGYLVAIGAALLVIDDWLGYMKGHDALLPWQRMEKGTKSLKEAVVKLGKAFGRLGTSIATALGTPEDSIWHKMFNELSSDLNQIGAALEYVLRGVTALADLGNLGLNWGKLTYNQVAAFSGGYEKGMNYGNTPQGTQDLRNLFGSANQLFASSIALHEAAIRLEAATTSETTNNTSINTNVSISGVPNPADVGGSLLRSAPTSAER